MRPDNVEVGQLYEYNNDVDEAADSNAQKGHQLRLVEDDGSVCPKFKPVGWVPDRFSDGFYESFALLRLVEEGVLPTQVGGDHYSRMKIQPIEFITANNIEYRAANVIKYVCRHANKNGAEDLRKAKHYIDMLLEDYDED